MPGLFRTRTGRAFVPMASAALLALSACTKHETVTINCTENPTAPSCPPQPIATASLSVIQSPKVLGDTTKGFATASTTAGSALAVPTYNGGVIAAAGNPAPFSHVPAVGNAAYGANPVQAGADLRPATGQTFSIAPIQATGTIDKTNIAVGDSVSVIVAAQVGRDSVVVFEGTARRASVLEGGGTVVIKPAAVTSVTISLRGYNGALTFDGSVFVVQVR